MKKIILLLTLLVGRLAVQADDYAYLTFEMTDGAKVSVPVEESLTLTINATTLTVGSQTDEDDIKKADINGDGKVNVADLVTLTNERH